jgi:hypothetical protein
VITLDENFEKNYSVLYRNFMIKNNEISMGYLNGLYEVWQAKQINNKLNNNPHRDMIEKIAEILYFSEEDFMNEEDLYIAFKEKTKINFSIIVFKSFLKEGCECDLFTKGYNKEIFYKLFEPAGRLYYEVYKL